MREGANKRVAAQPACLAHAWEAGIECLASPSLRYDGRRRHQWTESQKQWEGVTSEGESEKGGDCNSYKF